MPERNKTISLALAVTMVIAGATGAWAISTEVHNYRLSNLTSRVKEAEDLAMEHDRIIVRNTADMAFIKSALNRLLEQSDG